MEFWEVEQQLAYWRVYPPASDILRVHFPVVSKPALDDMTPDDFAKIPLPPGSLSFDELENFAKQHVAGEMRNKTKK